MLRYCKMGKPENEFELLWGFKVDNNRTYPFLGTRKSKVVGLAHSFYFVLG